MELFFILADVQWRMRILKLIIFFLVWKFSWLLVVWHAYLGNPFSFMDVKYTQRFILILKFVVFFPCLKILLIVGSMTCLPRKSIFIYGCQKHTKIYSYFRSRHPIPKYHVYVRHSESYSRCSFLLLVPTFQFNRRMHNSNLLIMHRF
jgi:hypothetical protein